jgi:hypothetical protein
MSRNLIEDSLRERCLALVNGPLCTVRRPILVAVSDCQLVVVIVPVKSSLPVIKISIKKKRKKKEMHQGLRLESSVPILVSNHCHACRW